MNKIINSINNFYRLMYKVRTETTKLGIGTSQSSSTAAMPTYGVEEARLGDEDADVKHTERSL